MARIRTIKPEFWTSEQIADLSPTARLLFIGIWNFCDDGGVHPASIMRLKMEIFPADSLDVRPLVEELLRSDLLRAFSAQGQSWWWVTGFLKHQKIDKPTLKYPQPFGEDSAITRRAVGESSPPEGKGREGKLEECKGAESNGPTSAAQPVARAVQPAKIFRPPSLDEVTSYCRERKNRVDPQVFIDHYESNGWKVGRNAMKDWRAAVRTWERNGFIAPKDKQKDPRGNMAVVNSLLDKLNHESE